MASGTFARSFDFLATPEEDKWHAYEKNLYVFSFSSVDYCNLLSVDIFMM